MRAPQGNPANAINYCYHRIIKATVFPQQQTSYNQKKKKGQNG
jgi:hypothetical protein